MINGSAEEFIKWLHYGDERFFLYNGNKYFIQGYFKENKPMLELYILESPDNNYPVAEFENAEIFDGKTFWEVEKDIEWVDC